MVVEVGVGVVGVDGVDANAGECFCVLCGEYVDGGFGGWVGEVDEC